MKMNWRFCSHIDKLTCVLQVCIVVQLLYPAIGVPQIEFTPKVDYGTYSRPSSIFIADLDGDGHKDLAVTSFDYNSVSTYKNKGDGTFFAAIPYQVGTGPLGVIAADLDGDGDLDLSVTDWYDSKVSVLRNNGDGTFETKVDYTAGDGPWYIVASDIDGDKDSDLLVTNTTSEVYQMISIFRNNGDGVFATNVGYGSGAAVYSIVACDLDGDGDQDFAAPIMEVQTLWVAMNDGNGNFSPPMSYPTAPQPYSICASDLDRDGDIDLVVGDYQIALGNDTVSVFKNNGDGTFASYVPYATGGGYVTSVCAADFDGDSFPDLAVANYAAGTISVFRNEGNGTFASKADIIVGALPWSVFASDIDGDGDNDLAVVNQSSNTVSILRNLYVNCSAIPGDVNSTGAITLGDIIHLVNYIFDKDKLPCLGTDPGNCWTPNPFCRGDVNQTGTITIGDIIHLVNYIFDKDRLPCLGSNLGNCWTPEANGACCLAVP